MPPIHRIDMNRAYKMAARPGLSEACYIAMLVRTVIKALALINIDELVEETEFLALALPTTNVNIGEHIYAGPRQRERMLALSRADLVVMTFDADLASGEIWGTLAATKGAATVFSCRVTADATRIRIELQ